MSPTTPSSARTRSPRDFAATALSCFAVLTVLAAPGCDRSGAPPADSARSGRPDQAAVTVETIESMRRSVERLLDADRADEALAIARPLAELAGDDWTVHELHGRAATGAAIAESRRRVGDAVDALRREAADAYARAAECATESAPHAVAPMLRTAAMMLDATGDTTGALRQYERAARAEPLDPQTPLFAAQVHLRIGRLADARVLIDRTLALEPDEPWGWATRAEIERQSGEVAAAMASVRTARRLDPGNHAIRLAEARLLRLLDRPEDALTLLLALAEEDRDTRPFVEEIALSWSAAGQPARSAEAWERLGLREPREWRHRFEAARHWLAAGDPVRAGAILESVLHTAPDDSAVIALRDAIGRRVAEDR